MLLNKTFISFFANILTGIIFILPVYSFSANQFDINTDMENSKSDHISESGEVIIYTIPSELSGNIEYTAIIPFQKKTGFSLTSSFHKNSFTGSFSIVNPNPRENEYSPPRAILFNQDYFTKITILNTLSTIKFLC